MDKYIDLEEGWAILEEGIAKAARFLEGDTQMRMSAEEHIKYYTYAYTMSMGSRNNCKEIYDRYKSALERCVSSMVLPSLMGKKNEFLLQELVRMWSNYQKMTNVTSHFLAYLNFFYIPFFGRPPLKTVAASCFFNLVFITSRRKNTFSVSDAVVSLMNREREEEEIDLDLINSFMGLISDADTVVPYLYKLEIEDPICAGTYAYYSQKSSEWLMSCTFTYAYKRQECLRMERGRAARYLILSRNFSRTFFFKLVEFALVNDYEKAFNTKMTKIITRNADSRGAR